jgi:hypothetical protein
LSTDLELLCSERNMHASFMARYLSETMSRISWAMTAASTLLVIATAGALGFSFAGRSLLQQSGQEFVYAARIALDSQEMRIEDRVVPLSPGMAVSVEIKTGRRRVIEYLMSPLLRYKQESLRER